MGKGWSPNNCCAKMVTSEKSANKAGVVRRIAKSDHWRSRLDAQMSTNLVKGDFNGPAQDKPLDDLERLCILIGTRASPLARSGLLDHE